jgi:hypothetical protein
MDDDNALIRILLAELVDELGGTAKLDATKILDNMKQGKFKQIGFHVDGNEAIVRIFEDED